MKAAKGSFGYITYEKKKRLIITLILLSLPLLFFFTGLYVTGNRNNLFTVVAVVGSLPACKSMVGLIMIFMQKSISKEEYEKISKHAKGLEMSYEMLITSYDKNAYIDAFAICGNTVVGYTSKEDIDINYVQEYVQKIVRHNGYKVDVKIMKELSKYLDRLDSMNKNREALEKDIKFTPDETYPELTRNQLIKHTILAISL